MTETYRAAVCTKLTGPDSIEIRSLPRKPLGNGEVRVQVKAAGLNFPDLLMTYGKYQFRPDPPFVPGLEVTGEISEIGPGVSGWALGDRVMGGKKGDCFAEEVILPMEGMEDLPSNLDFTEGACWGGAAATAWHALNDKADLKSGETVLILGASGGVGMAAVQLAKYRGAKIIAIASTLEKREAVIRQGADHALDPTTDNLTKLIKDLTNGKGVDVVFDPVGGSLSITATRAITWGGRYLIVGFASGVIPQFPANHALIKGYSLIGLRAGESQRRDPVLARKTKLALRHLSSQAIMRPHISQRFPLEEAANALRCIANRQVIGRAVLEMT